MAQIDIDHLIEFVLHAYPESPADIPHHAQVGEWILGHVRNSSERTSIEKALAGSHRNRTVPTLYRCTVCGCTDYSSTDCPEGCGFDDTMEPIDDE
ncbi:MAG: hypothetical protein AAFN11_00135 [Chloroflexota bacterium]